MRGTFVLRVAMHKWHSALVRRRERMAQADAPGAYLRALHRDTWVHWCQLYQSHLMQQGFAVHLIENYFERWKDNVRETDAMKEKADQLVLAREGRMLIRCWDSWVRSVELRSVERDVAERVGARVVSLWYFGKDDCA